KKHNPDDQERHQSIGHRSYHVNNMSGADQDNYEQADDPSLEARDGPRELSLFHVSPASPLALKDQALSPLDEPSEYRSDRIFRYRIFRFRGPTGFGSREQVPCGCSPRTSAPWASASRLLGYAQGRRSGI